MWEAFQSNPSAMFSVVFWATVGIVTLGCVGIKAWRKNEAGKRDSELKLEMLAKGMSAADIERVLAAKAIDS